MVYWIENDEFVGSNSSESPCVLVGDKTRYTRAVLDTNYNIYIYIYTSLILQVIPTTIYIYIYTSLILQVRFGDGGM